MVKKEGKSVPLIKLAYHQQLFLASSIIVVLGLFILGYEVNQVSTNYTYTTYLEFLPQHVENVSSRLLSMTELKIQNTVQHEQGLYEEHQIVESQDSKVNLTSAHSSGRSITLTVKGLRYIQDPSVWVYDSSGRLINLPMFSYWPESSGLVTQLHQKKYYYRIITTDTILAEVYIAKQVKDLPYVKTISLPVVDTHIQAYLDKQGMNQGMYFFIFSKRTGTLLVHPKLQGKNIYNLENIGTAFTPLKSDSSTSSGYVRYRIDGKDKTTYYHYIPEWDAYLCLGVTEDDVVGELQHYLTSLSLKMGSVILVVMLLCMGAVIYSINRKIGRVTTSWSTALEHRNLSLGSVDYPYRDRIQELIGVMDKLRDSLGQMIGWIHNSVATTSTGAQQVSDKLKQLQQCTADIVSYDQQATDDLTRLQDVNESVTAIVDTVKKEFGELTRILQEFQSSLQELQRTNCYLLEIKKELVDTFYSLKTKINQVIEGIQGISEFTGIIRTIANQTNILAINATIEAKRAGDAGEGFIVVANDIRNLAKNVDNTAKSIDGTIREIECNHTVLEKILSQGQVTVEQMAGAIDTTTAVGTEQISALDGILDFSNKYNNALQQLTEQFSHLQSAIFSLDTVRQQQSGVGQKLYFITEELHAVVQVLSKNITSLQQSLESSLRV